MRRSQQHTHPKELTNSLCPLFTLMFRFENLMGNRRAYRCHFPSCVRWLLDQYNDREKKNHPTEFQQLRWTLLFVGWCFYFFARSFILDGFCWLFSYQLFAFVHFVDPLCVHYYKDSVLLLFQPLVNVFILKIAYLFILCAFVSNNVLFRIPSNLWPIRFENFHFNNFINGHAWCILCHFICSIM